MIEGVEVGGRGERSSMRFTSPGAEHLCITRHDFHGDSHRVTCIGSGRRAAVPTGCVFGGYLLSCCFLFDFSSFFPSFPLHFEHFSSQIFPFFEAIIKYRDTERAMEANEVQVFAPRPVKPRRRQRSIMSLDHFKGASNSTSNAPEIPSDPISVDPWGQDNNTTSSLDWNPSFAAHNTNNSYNGNLMTPSTTNDETNYFYYDYYRDPVDELFQIMRNTSLTLNTRIDSTSSSATLPTSPVARTCRNPIIVNASFQDNNNMA
ncbi:hypothetical protein TRVA0_023S01596 [Trichomonascus vanleenenianus]|uniref:uncharacterized protein n=1 Tax=Trichomonascus vanleenenianus TaxID=2268995 RepID=UPI003EC9A8FF